MKEVALSPKAFPDLDARAALARGRGRQQLLDKARAKLKRAVENGALHAALYPGRTFGAQFDPECLRRVAAVLCAHAPASGIVACPEGPSTMFLGALLTEAWRTHGWRLRGLVVRWPDSRAPGLKLVAGPATSPAERALLFALVADSGQSLVAAARRLESERSLTIGRVISLLAFAPLAEEMRQAGFRFLEVHRINGELAGTVRPGPAPDAREDLGYAPKGKNP